MSTMASTAVWIALGLSAWLLLGVLVGVFVGTCARLRDHGDDANVIDLAEHRRHHDREAVGS